MLKKSYQNQDYTSFGEVVRAFLKEANVSKPPVSACLAVAGPVRNNVVRFTNRDSWEIDGDQIGEELGIKKVFLINDFVAAGYGVLTLNVSKECITLQKAEKQTTAPIACIGAGTGLGTSQYSYVNKLSCVFSAVITSIAYWSICQALTIQG